MQDYDPSQEPAAFDMGFNTLHRINYQLWKCNEASEKDDVGSWFKAIKNTYKEADAFMNDKEREHHEKRLKEVEKEYKVFLNYFTEYSGNIQRGVKMPFAPPRTIFDVLFNWEKELRRILDKKGLLMKKGEAAAETIQ